MRFVRASIVGAAAAACVLASVPAFCSKDDIAGLLLSWNSGLSTNQLDVSSGSAYVPSAGTDISLTSSTTVTISSPSASTFYYVYMTSTPSIITSTTAPMEPPYFGTALEDSSSSGDRYIGEVLTDSNGYVVPFQVNPDGLVQYLSAGPEQWVLTGGTATTLTNVSCSAVVPPTSVQALAVLVAPAANSGTHSQVGTAFFSNSAATWAVPPTTWLAAINNEYDQNATGTTTEKRQQVQLPLDGSQEFNYCFDVAPANWSVNVRIVGYYEYR